MKIAFIETTSFLGDSGPRPLSLTQVGTGFSNPKEAYNSLISEVCSVAYGPGVVGSIRALTEDGHRVHLFSLTSKLGQAAAPQWEDAKRAILEYEGQEMIIPDYIKPEYSI